MNSTWRLVRIGLVVLVFTMSAPGRAVEFHEDGGIDLTVSFEVDEEDDTSIPVPIQDPAAEGHYCDAFQAFSAKLYRLTEGRHYIHRVRFFEDVKFRDVRWLMLENYCCQKGSAGFKRILNAKEGTYPQDDPRFPYNPPRRPPNALGGLLLHEGGHFLYGQTDEYMKQKQLKFGKYGLCGDGQYTVVPDPANKYPEGLAVANRCDEEELQCNGAPCLFSGQCIQGTQPLGTSCQADTNQCYEGSSTPGAFCSNDQDCLPLPAPPGACLKGCGAGGKCIRKNKKRNDSAGGRLSMCEHPTNVPGVGVCVMTSSGRGRWCDGGKDGNGDQVAGATHVYTWQDKLDYGVDVEFDFGDVPGPPTGWKCYAGSFFAGFACDSDNDCPPLPAPDGACVHDPDNVGYSCWDKAASNHIDLENVHQIGNYPADEDIEPPPETECQWLIDFVTPEMHAALVVDRSGSMGYLDDSNPPREAVDLAMDGALYFYNEVENGNYAGVYLYNTATVAAQSDGSSLTFDQKAGDLDALDPTSAAGDTDIALAIDTAHSDIVAAPGVPNAERNMVIFSDGKHNIQGTNPYLEAQEACEDGINVHTIAYGDADSAALEKIAECGISWITGVENDNGNGFGEPDPLEIKTALARMVHTLADRDEILEERALLEPPSQSTVESRTFLVPDGAIELRFSWLANRTCALAGLVSPTCEPVLNLLVGVELESPTGITYSAGTPAGTLGGVYRTVAVALPEPGVWTARLDKTEPPSLLPGEWETKVPVTRLSWVAHVEHGSLSGDAWIPDRRLPPDQPVAILAEMRFAGLLTGIEAVATVTRAGSSWTVPLVDDGAHEDGAAEDGTYGGLFNPDGTWPGVDPGAYRVKVRMESILGLARSVIEDEYVGPPPDEDIFGLPELGDAVVEAETSFRLSTRYSVDPSGRPVPGSVRISCPDLQPGATATGLTAFVEGLPVHRDTTRITLGPGITLSNPQFSCPTCGDTSTDPIGQILFNYAVNPAAEPGPRDLAVQVGFEIIRAPGACVVSAGAPVPGEPVQLEVALSPLFPGLLEVSYLPACDAADHTIYYGPLGGVSTYGYTGAACGIGTSGAATFDPGGPSSVFFVVVGENGLLEGSYGVSSAGLERPEDLGTLGCDRPQSLAGVVCE